MLGIEFCRRWLRFFGNGLVRRESIAENVQGARLLVLFFEIIGRISPGYIKIIECG